MNSVMNNDLPPKPARDYSAMGKKGAAARTARGRKNSALNSLTHGLTAQSFVLLPREDSSLFAAHKAAYYAALRPVDAVESTYVDRMVETAWLINRSNEIESKSLANAIEHERNSRFAHAQPGLASQCPEALLAFYAIEKLTTQNDTYANSQRYRSTLERNLLRFHRQLLANRVSQPSNSTALNVADLAVMPSLFVETTKDVPEKAKLA